MAGLRGMVQAEVPHETTSFNRRDGDAAAIKKKAHQLTPVGLSQ